MSLLEALDEYLDAAGNRDHSRHRRRRAWQRELGKLYAPHRTGVRDSRESRRTGRRHRRQEGRRDDARLCVPRLDVFGAGGIARGSHPHRAGASGRLALVGPIAQLVALACHGNASLLGGAPSSNLLGTNSTCQFCEYVRFVRIGKTWLGKPKEVPVADSPEAWFSWLRSQDASGIRLEHQPSKDPQLPDHMSAGFVGGGGQTGLTVRRGGALDIWLARWEVGDQQAANRRIWRVTYGLIATLSRTAFATPSPQEARIRLEQALRDIRDFAVAEHSEFFVRCFDAALASLTDHSQRNGYHRDLYPEGTLSMTSTALLDAVQPAWVFGGMGSWNDQCFENTPHEYARVSTQLYDAVLDAIRAATNDSDRSSNS